MMSADPVIDFSDNNELNTQLTALYDSIESNLDSKVSSYTSDIKTSISLSHETAYVSVFQKKSMSNKNHCISSP